jgi:hypothetical protein
MTSRAQAKKAKQAKRMVAAKAVQVKAEKAPVNGKPTVQSILARFFSQGTPPAAEKIIAEVAKTTGRAPLSVSTLKLYRERFNAGKLGLQHGEKPKVKCPVLQTAAAK